MSAAVTAAPDALSTAPAAGAAPATAAAATEVADVLAACRAIVDERRYARHPFVAELERRQPDRAALGRWAVQKYHQVGLQNTIFAQIHVSAQDHLDVRKWAIDQLVAEETHHTSGSAGHYVLMRHFAEACGAPAAMFESTHAAPQVRSYVGVLNELCGQPDFVLGLLTIHSIESQSAEGVSKLLAWLRANHTFSDYDLEWFTVHSEEEDDHADAAMQMILRYAPGVDDFAHRAPACALRITEAWLRLQDFYLELLGERAVP
ncbi:MAG: iron-containing redox enzyme family protein [Frankia sp.]